ncbi:MAG TPA: aminotransferase class V-fold PLP-dependent enzyme [Gemmatimonadaceae bacterium]|nr:aminotransferase class V-fold PLP-dependent enzyme [Gemmatimonadaceae bacterium]
MTLPDTLSRVAPLDLPPDEFRRLGHALIDRIAEHLEGIRDLPVSRGESPAQMRAFLGGASLPGPGAAAGEVLEEAAGLLFGHSLLNGHPRFWGFITSSAAPLGMLGDLLAASVNANVGAFVLAPMATEIERQTVRWIAELIGYPDSAGGVMVSGGNMANMVAFLAARRARASWDIRGEGLRGGPAQLTLYTSQQTHTWIQKAADLFGLGLAAIRWIETDREQRMRIDALEEAIRRDREAGRLPFLVIGTAGSVSTGAIDPLRAIAGLCRREGLWFHVDGAYGAPAAALPEAPDDLKALALADSVAVDPHKWLYAPIEAGCTLVRDPRHLVDAFSFHPEYYNFDPSGEGEAPTNFYEFGPQNTRGFRALKVWLGLRQAGREGYVQSIRDDIALTAVMHDAVSRHPELQPLTLGLSVSTFRYVPPGRATGSAEDEQYLNTLNATLLSRLQAGGEAFVSNAVIDGKYALRACIVNFRTRRDDVEALPEIVVREGRILAADHDASSRRNASD